MARAIQKEMPALWEGFMSAHLNEVPPLTVTPAVALLRAGKPRSTAGRTPHTWGSIFRNALKRGEDHGYAAFLAGQWEKRQGRKSRLGLHAKKPIDPSQHSA